MRADRRNAAIVLLVAVLVLGGTLFKLVDTGGTTDGGTADDGTPSSPMATASSTDPASGLPWVDESALPDEARQTLATIDQGGPFPYDQDGTVFSNFEGHLPTEPRGYYHEYTVATPGSSDRGARRIITGADDEFYWTDDHYASFARIRRDQ